MPASGKYTLLGLEIETSCPATSSTTCSALLATRPPSGPPDRRAGQRLEPRRLALLREPAVQQLAARVAIRRGAEKRARYPLQRRRRRADARPTEDRVDGAHQDLKRPTLRLG